jgi:hypothetical protein
VRVFTPQLLALEMQRSLIMVRRPLVLLLLIAALAPTSAMASEWIRCRTDGEARKTCCCPADEREADPTRPTEIAAANCCDVDQIAGRTLDARALPDISPFAVAPPVRTVARIAPMPVATLVVVSQTEVAQPRGPPSLFAQNILLLV